MESIDQHKGCLKCREWKPWSAFGLSVRNKDGRRSRCKPCDVRPSRTETLRRYRISARNKAQQAKYHASTGYSRRREYVWRMQGIDPSFRWADFQAMLARQKGRCVFDGCCRPATDLDHDHSTGRPRGILCQLHNKAMGMFQDCPATLQAAINYLKTQENSLVPR